MAIQKFPISRDPVLYEAWPDVALTPGGKMIAVFNECTHHLDRSYTRIMLTESTDRGRTWSPKRPLTPAARKPELYYNCPRITLLRDGRLVIIFDQMAWGAGGEETQTAGNYLCFSSDDGATWSEPVKTPLVGIVPDKLLELDNGRWIISAHHAQDGALAQFLRWSDDRGKSWSDPVVVAKDPAFQLCEVSLLPLGNGVIAAFLRENSGRGLDCKKTLSFDNGESWGPLIDFPLPGCHRPVAGMLQDGSILITYRFHQGGMGGFGNNTQNFFAALTDRNSVLATSRRESRARILPIDFDRSPHADLGYSGWVQFPDGEIYIVYYIVDDAVNRGQIRGCSLQPSDFFLP